MQPPQQHSWINLAELKDQLIRKLGPERSKQYFDYLSRFLSLKLSKSEFDKLCIRTVGRDNISLHNQLIHSILKNACIGKLWLPKSSDVVYHQNGSIPVVNQAPLGLPNGDILPPSPRKARTGARERRGGDRRSSLGPNGKIIYPSSLSTPQSGDFSTALDNGNSNSAFPDTRKPMECHQELMQQAENGDEGSGQHPDGLVSVHNKDQTEPLGSKNGKEVLSRTLVHAPLGVSIGGARRSRSLASSSKCVSALDTNSLIETTTLRKRMEQIAATQGLQGVSIDCANVVNNGLDAYLKGLIWSSSQLNGARLGHEPIKHQAHLSSINGVRPGHDYQIQGSSFPSNAFQENESKSQISLLDFRVSMELNPQQLGEDWPLLLEKICTHVLEE